MINVKLGQQLATHASFSKAKSNHKSLPAATLLSCADDMYLDNYANKLVSNLKSALLLQVH